MDAKSIQMLRQLKAVMESCRKHEDVTGQSEFSDDTNKNLAGLVPRDLKYLESQTCPKTRLVTLTASKPDTEIDAATIELRKEFALLNKICALREISLDSNAKRNRKASRNAAIEAKRSESKSKLTKSVQKPKRAPTNKRDSLSKWIEKNCWRCKEKFRIHREWVNPSSLCSACTKFINETHLPSGQKHLAPVGWVHVVSGGAPGLGKR